MRDDRGSATVLVLALSLIVLAVGAVGTAVAAAVDARHHAAVAADGAALAAAGNVLLGPTAACELAAHVAHADGADLQACAVAGAVATVTVVVAIRMPWLGVDSHVRLNSRAGPAETNRDKATPPARSS